MITCAKMRRCLRAYNWEKTNLMEHSFIQNPIAKKCDVKEWATRVVYLVNQKFKDHNLIDASPYTYPCISDDGCIL